MAEGENTIDFHQNKPRIPHFCQSDFFNNMELDNYCPREWNYCFFVFRIFFVLIMSMSNATPQIGVNIMYIYNKNKIEADMTQW